MNYRTSLVALGVLGTSLCLSAQTFSFNNGDVVAAFTKSGSSDYYVNLGNISQFSGQAPGTTVDLSVKYTVSGNNLVNANFGGSTTGVSFTSFGLFQAAGSNNNPLYVTAQRPDLATQSVPYAPVSASAQRANVSTLQGVLGIGTTFGITQYTPAVSATLSAIPSDNANSFSAARGNIGGFNSTFPDASTVAAAPGIPALADLYAASKTSPNQSAFYGYFSMNEAGALSFTAVPEPEEYAAAFGGLALAGALIRRKLKK